MIPHNKSFRNGLLFAGVCFLLSILGMALRNAQAAALENGWKTVNAAPEYVVLAWNDLGMHCYNRDFSDLAVLPPFNTLWAQVIRIGDPPQIVTENITVEFFFADNTYSVGKSNFWDYDLPLFGVDLPPNIGLAGTGLSGQMTLQVDHFEAVGIPITEFSDSNLLTPAPYQLATVVVRSTGSGQELARTHPVAPVSTEMHCDYCHYDNGPGNEDIATGIVERNILSQHDNEHLEKYPGNPPVPLMDRRPILCAECHATNALGMPGEPGIPNLSKAMHEKHDGEVSDTLDGCYSCHPGPQTRCLRDVMSSSQHQIYCVDCHGTMLQVSHNPNPWLNEPRCDAEACHGSGFALDQPLYRMSKEHGGIYCAGCHDSPHAIAPSREANDAIKFLELQGHSMTLRECTVCHIAWPSEPGPHDLNLEPFHFIYMPLLMNTITN